MEKFTELCKKIAGDASLQQQLKALIKESTDAEKDAFLKNLGYDIPFSEFKAFIEQKKSDELSDADLDLVAGGTPYAWGILWSILTLGIECAVISIYLAATNDKCDEYYND